MPTENQKTPASLLIRPSIDADIPAIQVIYADNVLHGTGTFETEVPDAAEMARRRAEVMGRQLPYLVAGQGIGTLLLAELIARSEAAGARQMLAVIGDAENLGSIQLHRALGFEQTGVLKGSGWKFGRWLDVVLMQRQLGLGDTTNPEQPA